MTTHLQQCRGLEFPTHLNGVVFNYGEKPYKLQSNNISFSSHSRTWSEINKAFSPDNRRVPVYVPQFVSERSLARRLRYTGWKPPRPQNCSRMRHLACPGLCLRDTLYIQIIRTSPFLLTRHMRSGARALKTFKQGYHKLVLCAINAGCYTVPFQHCTETAQRNRVWGGSRFLSHCVNRFLCLWRPVLPSKKKQKPTHWNSDWG